jgi:hypothetical protein
MMSVGKACIFWVANSLLGCLMAAHAQSAAPTAPAALPQQPTSNAASCVITGSVANGLSGAPVKRAHLSVDDAHGLAAVQTQTDVEGKFVLSGLAPGTHEIFIRRHGYVDSRMQGVQCDQQNDSAPDASNRTAPLLVRILPLGVISGEVTDDAGVPVAGAVVRAYPYRAGRLSAGLTATTNDLGMYRLYGLEPGEYYISAEPDSSGEDLQYVRGDSPSDYSTTFYPQATDVNAATRLSVNAGYTASGMNIQLKRPLKTRSSNLVNVSATSGAASLPSAASAAAAATAYSAGENLPATAPGNATRRAISRSSASGMVVNEATHEPVRHAKVTLAATSGSSSSSYSTLTDNAGLFSIDGMPPGTYHATLDRAGFLHAAHLSGSPRQVPALVAIKPEHELRNIVLEAIPGSVITGRVLDPDGDPVPDVHVQAMQSRSALGKPQMQMVAMSKTNDLGEYRLYGLSHGQYYVSATTSVVEANAPERSATTFFPNAVDFSAATPVAINDATQMGGIDITSIVPTLVDVRGTVSCSSAPLRRDTVVALKRQGADADVATTSTTGIDAEGHFRFQAVAPGAYSLSAFFVDEHGRYGGTQTFEVRNTELDNIDVPLSKALSMSGRIQIEGSGQNLNFSAVRVLVEPESDFLAGSLVADIKPDGSFVLNGVLPSEYTLSIVGLPAEYYVKKVQIGMQDIAGRKLDFSHNNGALDVVISSSGGTISGAIVDTEQQPAPGVSVALVPDPPRPDAPDLYKILRTNAQGQFSILGVAPGHYQLFAIQGADSNAYVDSDWVNSLQDYSKQISIDENSTITLTIGADSIVQGAQ